MFASFATGTISWWPCRDDRLAHRAAGGAVEARGPGRQGAFAVPGPPEGAARRGPGSGPSWTGCCGARCCGGAERCGALSCWRCRPSGCTLALRPGALPRDIAVMQTYDRIQAAFPGESIPATVVVEADDVTPPQIGSAAIEELEDARSATARSGADHGGDQPGQDGRDGRHPLPGDGTDDESDAALRRRSATTRSRRRSVRSRARRPT